MAEKGSGTQHSACSWWAPAARWEHLKRRFHQNKDRARTVVGAAGGVGRAAQSQTRKSRRDHRKHRYSLNREREAPEEKVKRGRRPASGRALGEPER